MKQLAAALKGLPAETAPVSAGARGLQQLATALKSLQQPT
jgi:hypothetical protein